MPASFDTATLPARDRFDAYRQAISSTFVPLAAGAPSGERRFYASVASSKVGPIQVSEVAGAPHVVMRSRRLVGAAPAEYYKIGLQLSGTSILRQDDRVAELCPGDFAVYDTTRRYELEFRTDYRMLVVMIPRPLLPVPLGQMAGLSARTISGGTGMGVVVFPFLVGLRKVPDAWNGTVGTHLSDAVLDVLAAAFSAELADESARTPDTRHGALLADIRMFIERHLSDPGLCPGSVAAAHHISESYLQKLFASTGVGVSGWIRQRRLEKCRRDLAAGHDAHKPVAAIGARWGLTDPSHFSRLFKSAFDLTPGEYRNQMGLATRPGEIRG
ncbi:helix-turn-helix domain-containing protein [Phytoactinopolyspora endophytica]|uniref:AraC-like ligand-binding domain-containing protein n=1 Tax=Phytoactinopolyspora endophytica TaxID=1642495 RepID=UPI00101C63AF|nr:helix-turn-helix domain-containing protein [Phytoactinopolyspora endophytica]